MKLRPNVFNFIRRLMHTEVAPGFTGPQSGSPKKVNRLLRITAAGFGAGAIVGLGFAYDQYRKANVTVVNREDDITYVLNELPSFVPSRKVTSA